ncbi:hypothetical protein JXD20_03415 [Candidatus Peregrinibacteria bacterium]|nr:hypothetical protein [Candidatus Peregrinibacteria bacterium]
MKIYGKKAEALFDQWTLGHVFFFYLVTKLFLVDMMFERAILILIGLGYIWEFIERILENWDHSKRFFKEKEGWLNRYIGDILADMAGFLLAWFV